MKVHLILILVGAVSLLGCKKNVLIDKFHEIPETGWNYTYIIEDSFQVSQPEYFHQVYGNLRIRGDYDYANIYLKVSITAPDSSIKEEVVPIQLADKTGKWLGSGIGDIITYQVPIMNKLALKEEGQYKVKLEQYMRLENLQHVVSAGIKVTKEEELL